MKQMKPAIIRTLNVVSLMFVLLAWAPPTLQAAAEPRTAKQKPQKQAETTVFNFGAISSRSTSEDVINIYGRKDLSEKRSTRVKTLDYSGILFNCDLKTDRVVSVQIFDEKHAKHFARYFNRDMDEFVNAFGIPSKTSREDPTVMLRYQFADPAGKVMTMTGLFFGDDSPRLYSISLNWNPK